MFQSFVSFLIDILNYVNSFGWDYGPFMVMVIFAIILVLPFAVIVSYVKRSWVAIVMLISLSIGTLPMIAAIVQFEQQFRQCKTVEAELSIYENNESRKYEVTFCRSRENRKLDGKWSKWEIMSLKAIINEEK